jgi:hypothetical protein
MQQARTYWNNAKFLTKGVSISKYMARRWRNQVPFEYCYLLLLRCIQFEVPELAACRVYRAGLTTVLVGTHTCVMPRLRMRGAIILLPPTSICLRCVDRDRYTFCHFTYAKSLPANPSTTPLFTQPCFHPSIRLPTHLITRIFRRFRKIAKSVF